MPTYEYECRSCQATFEAFQSITAAPLRKCPHCGARRVRRLISAGAGILFRGSGFYETDYRSEEYRKRAKAERQEASPGQAKDQKGDKPKKSAKKASSEKASSTAD